MITKRSENILEATEGPESQFCVPICRLFVPESSIRFVGVLMDRKGIRVVGKLRCGQIHDRRLYLTTSVVVPSILVSN